MDNRRIHVIAATGKVLTDEEFEHIKNNPGTNVGVYEVLVRLIDGIDENGYVINWNREEMRRKMTEAAEEAKMHRESHEETSSTHSTETEKKESTKQEQSADDDFDIPEFMKHRRTEEQYEQRTDERRKRNMNSEERHENMHGFTDKNFDRETAENIYSRARKNSATARKHAAHVAGEETVPKKKKANVKVLIIAILTLLALSLGAVAYNGIEYGISEHQENIANQTFAAMTINYAINNEEGITTDLTKGNEKEVSLLDLVTVPTKDRQGCFVDTGLCAEYLATIPDQFFEAGLYSVFAELEEDQKSQYVNLMDRIINQLNMLIEEEAIVNGEPVNAANNPRLFTLVHGCITFQDYLKNNNFASVKDYKNHGKAILKEFNSYMKAIGKDFANADSFTPEIIAMLEEGQPSPGGR